ncbi:phage tail protein [Natronolimnobius sp. AArcel1]|uniref:phage baseplate assembly protein V n=1 Tax=Natronolimnobius sp. AArcel1 TaxID=1679093 RepID=UPI0013ED3C47|nr:phage baseplate assembly protein V [Natronolimnobius sp. AArcel1]NGM68011.1 phage tail protein [Natronolimnobius sp. AArcel1]
MSSPGFFDGETAEGGIQGVVVGIVTDNDDPKDLGRVKLRFPWRDADDESYWARIATPMAGDEYGTYFLPEVDDEVLVAFENGDIHEPYVIGSLWNGEQKPPRRNEGHNNTREIRSRSDHTIAFDDSDDGSITIRTSDGHEIVVDDSSGSETVAIRDDRGKNTITLDSSSGRISIEADDELDLSASKISIDGTKSVEISGGTDVDISSKNTIELSSKARLDISSSGLMGIDSTGPLTIRGALIQLN